MKIIKIAAAAIFFTIILFAPSTVASAASCGETVSRSTSAELKKIDCENNETIAGLLKPSRYTVSEKQDKKEEIARREGKSSAQISDEDAVKELDQDNVIMMSDAFEEMQAEIEGIIREVVNHTDNADQKGADYFINRIRNNKEKLLVGLAYLDRLYDFEMGGHNIRDMLLYESKPYRYINGQMIDNVLDWLIYIGGCGGDVLRISNNAKVFTGNNPMALVTTAQSLQSFLEENRKQWIPDTPMNDWFVRESRAYILETSCERDGKRTELYQRLCDMGSQAYILPLLTVSEDSVYVIANSATITYGTVDCYLDRNVRETDPARYKELREEFRQQLKQVAQQQQAFLDCWYRIAKPEKKKQLSLNGDVLDSMRMISDNPNASAKDEWSDRVGKNAARGISEFFAPLNLYTAYKFVDGEAQGTRIRYYISKALTERGLATYAHELTHILAANVMLNGYGSRDGMLAEVYTRGMFEPYELNDPPAFNLNLIYDRAGVSDRYHNGIPGRFRDERDLQTYMRGILDVVYTLDYAEADVILTKSAEEKKKWFHKLEQIQDSSQRVNQGEAGSVHYLDSVRELSLDEAEKLNTIDDLIRDSILVSRYEVNGMKTTGTMNRNGYYVVPLFSANYAGVQNDSGVSGDITIRRQAFEFLAEYGYYDGMVPYISNQYKEAAKSEQTLLSDQYILKKISHGSYETMADFKKAMFQRRIEKLDELKPVTIMWKNQSVEISNYETLRQLMKEAVESDLIKVNVLPDGWNNIRAQATEVERLKQEIYKAYLIQTEDFSKSVYNTAADPDKSDFLVMSQNEMKLHVGSGKMLSVRKGSGGVADLFGLVWESSDNSVASVDQLGNVKALKGGTVWITVRDTDGKTASCKVTVEDHHYKTVIVKASLSKNGKTVKRCTVCKAETGATVIYYPKTIQLSSTKYVYNGKVRKPSVTVKDSRGKKIASSNYRVSYAEGRKKAGRYTVKITFKGNYTGTVRKSFDIRPKTTSISKLRAGRKSIFVKWKKQSDQTTGYQIQYSVNKSFKKGAKTTTVGKVKTTSKKISKLKAGKKYYVRIRTYKTIKVNKKSVKIYSDWSKAKKVKTK